MHVKHSMEYVVISPLLFGANVTSDCEIASVPPSRVEMIKVEHIPSPVSSSAFVLSSFFVARHPDAKICAFV